MNDYDTWMKDLINRVIDGCTTWDEADKECWERGHRTMNVIDVECELRQGVRAHAMSVAPVYTRHLWDVINKLIDSYEAERKGQHDE